MFVISISCSLLKRGHLDGVLAQHEPQPIAIVISVVPSNPGDDAPIGADTDQHTCRMPLTVDLSRLTTVRSLRIQDGYPDQSVHVACQLLKSA